MVPSFRLISQLFTLGSPVDFHRFSTNWDLRTKISLCLHKVHPLTLVRRGVSQGHYFSRPPCFRAPNLMPPSELLTNTLKYAQAPPVCQTCFPSDSSRWERESRSLTRCSCHLPTTVYVCPMPSMPPTGLAAHIRTRQISSHCNWTYALFFFFFLFYKFIANLCWWNWHSIGNYNKAASSCLKQNDKHSSFHGCQVCKCVLYISIYNICRIVDIGNIKAEGRYCLFKPANYCDARSVFYRSCLKRTALLTTHRE